MAGVLQTSQPLGERFTLPAANSPGNVDVIVVDPAVGPAGAVAPFRTAYFVDPLFAGVQTGSMSNPFTTIAAAFAFAAATAVTSGIVYIAEQSVLAENVVFPTTGNWEIASLSTVGAFSAVINGTVDLTCTAVARRALSNLNVTGAVTGNAPAGTFSRALITNCFLTSTTLTSAAGAGGGWRCMLQGATLPGNAGLGGANSGPINIAGDLIMSNWQTVGVTVRDASWMDQCTGLGPFASSAPGIANWFLTECTYNAGSAFSQTGGGQLIVFAGGYTASLAPSWTAGAGVTFHCQTGMNGVRTPNLANNVGASGLLSLGPYNLVTFEGALTLITPGTLGNAQLQVQYTDLVGVLRTVNVGPALNIAGAAGTEVSGSLVFSRAVTSAVGYLVTGIVTPGALNYSLGVNARIGQ